MQLNTIYNEPNLETMARMPDGYLDCIVTDPPYGYSFMQKEWDRAVPSVEIWKECLRVLKPGAFAFIMCAPRQDVLSHMIVNLTQAGFRTDFTSLYHCYASGFPKAGNMSKLVDKKLGAEREVTGKYILPGRTKWNLKQADNPELNHSPQPFMASGVRDLSITAPASDEAKKLAGSFTGFNPKPALEVIIVVMRPLETKTFTEQAMKNGHGCTWLDDCRIPTTNKDVEETRRPNSKGKIYGEKFSDEFFSSLSREPCNGYDITQGRFPANLLVSDDALNDGNVYESGGAYPIIKQSNENPNVYSKYNHHFIESGYNDSGSFSRYFSLDAWFAERLKNFPKSVLQTFPFLIEPKASKSEKNFGLSGMPDKSNQQYEYGKGLQNSTVRPDGSIRKPVITKNIHNTVKPVKLMSYLITLGSREGEIVYDPFCGSGSTGVAAEMLNRKWILSETDKDSCAIAEKRLYPFKIVQKLF